MICALKGVGNMEQIGIVQPIADGDAQNAFAQFQKTQSHRRLLGRG